MTARLALRLAFSRDVRQRWRQVSVITASFIAVALVLLGAGIVTASQASDSRREARSPVFASSPARAGLKISSSGPIVDGHQVPVVWLEPVTGHESDPAVVPPGLTRLPAPGEGVLSPGLTLTGFTADDFGLLASTAGSGPGGTIGLSGVSTSSEGWIYARPPAGRSLGTGGSLQYLRGYGGSGERFAQDTQLEIPNLRSALLGVTWMLLAPIVMLVFGAARALSAVRDDRAQTLLRLGVTSARIRLILAVETMFLAASGGAVALTAWLTWLSGARSLPLTGTRLVPGALRFPWWEAVTLTLVVLALIAASAVVGRVVGRTLTRSSRTVRPWHAAPLMVALSMMVGSRWAPPYSTAASLLLFGGLLLTLAALPMALPVLVAKAGGQLARARRPAIWLAGRRLSLRSANLSRPAAAVGTLVFLAGGASAIYGHLISTEASATSEVRLTRFLVSWRDDHPGDVAAIQQRIRDLRVIPVTESPTGQAVASFTSCEQIAEAITPLALHPCGGSGSLVPAFAREFRRITGVSPAIGTRRVTEASYVLLMGRSAVTERQVMKALAGALPAVTTTQIGAPQKLSSAQASWMLAGWFLATVVLALAILREIGDRALASLGDDRDLQRLGLTTTEIARTHRWTVLPPIAAAIPVGYIGAVAFALFGFQLGFTVANLATISGIALLVGGMAVICLGAVFRIHRRIAAS
jgi:hypothetical protein